MDLGACLQHLHAVEVFHPATERLVRVVFEDYVGPITPSVAKSEGLGFRHVVGRIDLSLCMMAQKQLFAWVYPETGLHPAQQTQLADVIIELAMGPAPRA